MTRGKYGAKAANRMSRLDNEIIAGLREELSAIKAERDEARQEVATLQSKMASDLHRAARALSEARIAEVTQGLAAEREERAKDRERLGEETFAVFAKHDYWPHLDIQAAIASVFGISHRIGQVMCDVDGKSHNRHARRSNAGKLRHLQASFDADDRRV